MVQRVIENSGIPTVLIAALPTVANQAGTPRSIAPDVSMGANAGEPNNERHQKEILKKSLQRLVV